MRQLVKNLDTFTGVGYGQTASLVLVVGATYNAIGLETDGLHNDQVESVILELNGVQIINVAGKYFRDKEAFLNNAQADGVFIIQFLNNYLKTNEGQRVGELVTLSSDKLVLKVKIGAKRAGQTHPSLSGWSEVTASQSVRRFIPKILRDRVAIGAVGLNTFRTFAKGGRIFGMHIQSRDVEKFELHVNDLLRHENTPLRNNRLLSRCKFVPQNDVYHFFPVATGFGLLDSFNTAVDKLEFKLTMRKSGDVDVIYELIESADNPQLDPFLIAKKK